jgi:hypothetical protein
LGLVSYNDTASKSICRAGSQVLGCDRLSYLIKEEKMDFRGADMQAAEARDRLAAKDAEIDLLARDRDDWMKSAEHGLEVTGNMRQERDDAQAENERLRWALGCVKGFGDVDLSGEWESSLRDIIRSMTECAKEALRANEQSVREKP